MNQKAQEGACVALIFMKMKPPWEYCGDGSPWIGTTGFQVICRDSQRKWLWIRFFSRKLIEKQFLNAAEGEDLREKAAGQQTLHKLKQALKTYLIL